MPHLLDKLTGNNDDSNDYESDSFNEDSGSEDKTVPKKDETAEPVKSFKVDFQDGEYSYSVSGEDGSSKEYKTESVDELLGWIKDDLESPHVKKSGTFAGLRDKILNRPGFKSRYSGQSKKEAASAVAASIKDKTMPGWRKDRG